MPSKNEEFCISLIDLCYLISKILWCMGKLKIFQWYNLCLEIKGREGFSPNLCDSWSVLEFKITIATIMFLILKIFLSREGNWTHCLLRLHFQRWSESEKPLMSVPIRCRTCPPSFLLFRASSPTGAVHHTGMRIIACSI